MRFGVDRRKRYGNDKRSSVDRVLGPEGDTLYIRMIGMIVVFFRVVIGDLVFF